MDGKARIRAEDWRLSVSIGCPRVVLYFSTSFIYAYPLERSSLRRMPCSTGECVSGDLELLITEMARHQAHHYQCSLAAATRQIRDLMAEARAEYRARGAPYGDDDQGFCRWLLAKPRLTPSA